jgi:hypothetical protein
VVLKRSIVLVTVGDQWFLFNRGHMALIRCELLRGIGRWPRLLIGQQTRLVTPFQLSEEATTLFCGGAYK